MRKPYVRTFFSVIVSANLGLAGNVVLAEPPQHETAPPPHAKIAGAQAKCTALKSKDGKFSVEEAPFTYAVPKSDQLNTKVVHVAEDDGRKSVIVRTGSLEKPATEGTHDIKIVKFSENHDEAVELTVTVNNADSAVVSYTVAATCGNGFGFPLPVAPVSPVIEEDQDRFAALLSAQNNLIAENPNGDALEELAPTRGGRSGGTSGRTGGSSGGRTGGTSGRTGGTSGGRTGGTNTHPSYTTPPANHGGGTHTTTPPTTHGGTNGGTHTTTPPITHGTKINPNVKPDANQKVLREDKNVRVEDRGSHTVTFQKKSDGTMFAQRVESKTPTGKKVTEYNEKGDPTRVTVKHGPTETVVNHHENGQTQTTVNKYGRQNYSETSKTVVNNNKQTTVINRTVNNYNTVNVHKTIDRSYHSYGGFGSPYLGFGYYGGGYFYTPPMYYAPVAYTPYFGVYTPWASIFTPGFGYGYRYSWGWSPLTDPWFGAYNYYFTPAVVYTRPAVWGIDYMTADMLATQHANDVAAQQARDAARADQSARDASDAAHDAQQAAAEAREEARRARNTTDSKMDDNLKKQLADQFELITKLSEENAKLRAAGQAVENKPIITIDKVIGDVNWRMPIMGDDIDGLMTSTDTDLNGKSCSLTSGDIISLVTPNSAKSDTVRVRVVTSKKGSCPVSRPVLDGGKQTYIDKNGNPVPLDVTTGKPMAKKLVDAGGKPILDKDGKEQLDAFAAYDGTIEVSTRDLEVYLNNFTAGVHEAIDAGRQKGIFDKK